MQLAVLGHSSAYRLRPANVLAAAMVYKAGSNWLAHDCICTVAKKLQERIMTGVCTVMLMLRRETLLKRAESICFTVWLVVERATC